MHTATISPFSFFFCLMMISAIKLTAGIIDKHIFLFPCDTEYTREADLPSFGYNSAQHAEKLSREETTEQAAHHVDHRESKEGAAQHGLSGKEDVHGAVAGQTSSKGISSDVESRERTGRLTNCVNVSLFKLNFRPFKKRSQRNAQALFTFRVPSSIRRKSNEKLVVGRSQVA